MSDVNTDIPLEGSAPSGPMGCALCATPLVSSYFEVGGQVICSPCRERAARELSQSSAAGRFFRAATYGALTAALGAAVYFGIAKATGYEFGLVAVFLGLGVGYAVRKGSESHGGWVYQTLAMGLTYAAIVVTYTPALFNSLKEAAKVESKPAATAPAVPDAAQAVPATESPGEKPADAPNPPGKTPVDRPSPVMILLSLVGLGVLLLASPFLAGFQNIMGLVILGIGLYEAWKVNRCAPVAINGPFFVGQKPPPAA
jgi:hypothetical protein